MEEVERWVKLISGINNNKLDSAYWERNQLVCLLSKVFPSWLEKHPESDEAWEKDWTNIVFIQLPTGNACWHIHDRELSYFDHLSHKEGNSWDGSSTPEKYKKILSIKPMRDDGSSM